MTEINANAGLPIQPGVSPKETKPAEAAKAVPAEPVKEMTQKDLGNVPAAAIGQSQIQVKAVDSLENDLKTLLDNPELVKKSLVIGEKAEAIYKADGVEDAHLKALNVAKAFADEFAK